MRILPKPDMPNRDTLEVRYTSAPSTIYAPAFIADVSSASDVTEVTADGAQAVDPNT